MWKVPLFLVTAGFSAPFFYPRVGAKFWEMCNLFSTFPRPVKDGEWNVKNPLNFVPAYKCLVRGSDRADIESAPTGLFAVCAPLATEPQSNKVFNYKRLVIRR